MTDSSSPSVLARLQDIRARLAWCDETHWAELDAARIFSANAPSDIRWLLSQVEELRKDAERLDAYEAWCLSRGTDADQSWRAASAVSVVTVLGKPLREAIDDHTQNAARASSGGSQR